jgi:DNA replication protein DnaC
MSELELRLKSIGLNGIAEGLDDLIAMATKKRLGAAQLLEQLVEVETKERQRRSIERRQTAARLGRFKPMADFDWAWPKKIDREQVESALRLEFLAQNRNVVLVAPQGVGKTMLARNICHQAVLKGHSALFITASQLLLDLSSQDSASGLERRLRHYQRPSILCIDEVGYLSYDNRNADLLFQIVSRRYETKSLILTTNLAFGDWPTIFPNAACTTALIDRVVHHSEIIAIDAESYRRREAETAKKNRKAKTKSLDQETPDVKNLK